MPLSDLSSRNAVQQALDEFDRVGREAFLAKYGFGQARQYFLRCRNRLYDSKAIAGAAFGYQFPDQGPLRAQQFTGGEATVQSKLEELGFEIVVASSISTELSTDNDISAAADLEKAFHLRMLDIYSDAKDIGYNASRFLSMITDRGGLETARILLRSSTVSDGYTALWERGRLDLTVEAVILDRRWESLFNETDRDIAIKRLRDYGYKPVLPTS